MNIKFLNDVDALVIGTSATFGSVEEERFNRNEVVEVRCIGGDEASDMALIELKDGRKTSLSKEDFEVA